MFSFLFNHHCLLPSQLVGGVALSALRDRPWSHGVLSSRPRSKQCLHSFLRSRGFSSFSIVSTACRFAPSFGSSRRRTFGDGRRLSLGPVLNYTSPDSNPMLQRNRPQGYQYPADPLAMQLHVAVLRSYLSLGTPRAAG